MRWRRACRGDPLDDQSRYIAAGGLNDAIARALGQRLAEAWGQQVVVENKPGANSQVGATLSRSA
jgi:tripartite-type tricarboxylate transporter receptor subunit TctC